MGIFQALIANPQDELAGWSALAASFLDRYTNQSDLYRACEVTDLCDLQLAVKQRVESNPASVYGLVVDRLGREGIPVRASGFFDFSGDRQLYRWFTVRHPNRILLELWISVPGPDYVHALHLDTIDTDVPAFTDVCRSGPAARGAVVQPKNLYSPAAAGHPGTLPGPIFFWWTVCSGACSTGSGSEYGCLTRG